MNFKFIFVPHPQLVYQYYIHCEIHQNSSSATQETSLKSLHSMFVLFWMQYSVMYVMQMSMCSVTHFNSYLHPNGAMNHCRE